MIGILKALFGPGGEQVGPREAVQRINRGAVLVDVREPGEFAAGHAPDAVHVPLGRIRMQGTAALAAAGVPPGVGEVLLICRSGMRSRIAQNVLSGDGRYRYVNVDGGMAAWIASGLPSSQGRGRTA
jgi:Rhodanese-related sulfurtransferase